MNTCFNKSLKCFFCSEVQSIEEADFPEDLFDLLFRYKINQVLWTCGFCRKNVDKIKLNFRSNVDRGVDIHRPAMSYREIDTFSNDLDTKYVDASIANEQRISRSRSLNENSQGISGSGSRSPSPPGSSKKDKSALKHIHAVLNEIKITSDQESNSRKIVKNVMEKLLMKLKDSEKIGCFVNRYYYTGSAFNDLRITSATEFDVDLVLKVPKYINLRPVFLNRAYVKLQWEGVSTAESHRCFIKLFNDVSCDNYLNTQKIISLLQSEIDLIPLEELESVPDVLKIKYSESGPARTIIIDTHLDYSISIDLVPVFEFDHSVLNNSPLYDEATLNFFENFQVDTKQFQFYAVPKESDEIDVLKAHSKLFWRLDFPNAEKGVLSSKQCAKPVIKLLKIFRDKRDWKALASYYLKMVVILEIIKKPQQEYWNNCYLYQRLLDCFKQLNIYLMNKHLPHFITQSNLFHKFNASQCTDWSNYLVKNVIGPLEVNTENLKNIFKEVIKSPAASDTS